MSNVIPLRIVAIIIFFKLRMEIFNLFYCQILLFYHHIIKVIRQAFIQM